MTLGQGAQALAQYLRSNWEPTRPGRPDIPDHVRDSSGDPTTDDGEATSPGVMVLADRQDKVNVNRAYFDPIYVYHPEADPPTIEDRGHVEERQEEAVQIDIEATDRTAPDTGERLNARNRMVGDRGASEPIETGGTLGTTSGFTLGTESGATTGQGGETVERYADPGLLGEVKYLLELTRRGLDEWDVTRTDLTNIYLGNSNANVSYRVTLVKTATNTADI